MKFLTLVILIPVSLTAQFFSSEPDEYSHAYGKKLYIAEPESEYGCGCGLPDPSITAREKPIFSLVTDIDHIDIFVRESEYSSIDLNSGKRVRKRRCKKFIRIIKDLSVDVEETERNLIIGNFLNTKLTEGKYKFRDLQDCFRLKVVLIDYDETKPIL